MHYPLATFVYIFCKNGKKLIGKIQHTTLQQRNELVNPTVEQFILDNILVPVGNNTDLVSIP